MTKNLNLNFFFFFAVVGVCVGWGGWGCAKTITVCQKLNVKCGKIYKKRPSTHCRACGTINISKYVNNFSSTNPTTPILSSLVSELTKNPNLNFFFGWGEVGGGGGGGGGGRREG